MMKTSEEFINGRLKSYKRLVSDVLDDLISVYYKPGKPVIYIKFAGNISEMPIKEIEKIYSEGSTLAFVDFIIDKFPTKRINENFICRECQYIFTYNPQNLVDKNFVYCPYCAAEHCLGESK